MYRSVLKKKIPMAPILRTIESVQKPDLRITMGKNERTSGFCISVFPMLNFPPFCNNPYTRLLEKTLYAFIGKGGLMPKIKIIVVGNTKSPFLKAGELFYLKRLRLYTPLEWIEVKPEKVTKGMPEKRILALEGRSILKKFHTKDHIIALDIAGKEYTSKTLSTRIEQLRWKGDDLCFVIGGPLGMSTTLLESAHESLSLSKLTLTHEMTRLILLEQLYRSFTIIRGEKYHK